MTWGRRKDNNQPYVKGAKRGVKSSKTNSVSDVHLKTVSEKIHRSNFYGEPEGEYELYDILEYVNDKNIDAVVKENIEFVLKREKKWSKEIFRVQFPAGSLQLVRDERDDESGFYQYDFTVWHGMENVAAGTAYGTISGGQMLDMTVELYNRKE